MISTALDDKVNDLYHIIPGIGEEKFQPVLQDWHVLHCYRKFWRQIFWYRLNCELEQPNFKFRYTI